MSLRSAKESANLVSKKMLIGAFHRYQMKCKSVSKKSPRYNTPGIVVYQHGPFAWGKDAHDAVHNAVVMEEVAKMAWIARGINPQLNHIDSYLMNKHFMRKHGPNAYYGQK